MTGIIKEIELLKKMRQAVVLAHNYQRDEVQDIADFVGDSLALSCYAATTPAPVLVLAGVRFMAESASILAPDKIILIPDNQAGCPLADSVDVDGLRQEKAKYPDAAVVCYVNTSAAVKAESYICCTSSNAVSVVQSLPQRRVLFIPDRNLASFIARFTDKEIIPWEGNCITHNRVTLEEVVRARAAHPQAEVLVHPECRPEVTQAADFVGSTGAIIKYARESKVREFLIGTEMGILHHLQLDNPEKKFYLLSPELICQDMKLTGLEKIARCLREMQPVVQVPVAIRDRAYLALERMLAL